MRKLLTITLIATIGGWGSAAAEVHYFRAQPETQPTPEIIAVDDANRMVVMFPPAVPLEYLTFPSPSTQARRWDMTDNGTHRYIEFDYINAADNFRMGRILIPEWEVYPHLPLLYLMYPWMSEPVVLEGLIHTRSVPSPVLPVTYTKEELQQASGTVTVPGVGDITFPWETLGAGESITIEGDPAVFELDGLSTASAPFAVTAPESLTGFTVDFDVNLGGDSLFVMVNEIGVGLDDEPYEWSILDAIGTVVDITKEEFSGAFRRYVLVPLAGQDCVYDHTDVRVSVHWREPCTPEPFWLIDVVDSVRAARDRLGPTGEGFTLEPVQEVYFLSGPSGPENASVVKDQMYINTVWFDGLSSQLKRAGVMYHETAHAVFYSEVPEQGQIPRNWMLESPPVFFEWLVDPLNTSWRERYAWSPDIVERGLGSAVRDREELYTSPFILFHLFEEEHPLFNLHRFHRLGRPNIINNDGRAVLIDVLGTDYDSLRQIYGEAASKCHQNLFTLQNVFNLCGDGNLNSVVLDAGPMQLQSGRTVLWTNPVEGDVTLHVESSPDANVDTLITMATAGGGGFSLSVDGALEGHFPIAALPEGPYAFTVSSLEGIDFLGNSQFVTVEVEREEVCDGLGPEVFGALEYGRARDASCAVYGPSILIRTQEDTWDCVAPAGERRGMVTFEHHIRQDISAWPYTVIGDATGGSIPREHWPPVFTPGTIPGVDCLPPGVYVWGTPEGSNNVQKVSWAWDCQAAGNCDTPGMRPPEW